ncbi:hypothetical protein PSH49_21820 [Pseudoalteromonas sp. GABNS16G]|nr:hypothetical protein [Pseudoalteromonas sp. GABNS16G]MDC9603216.1 hypothetical protein [Pseudoalteromonas sp. GABNS16G]
MTDASSPKAVKNNVRYRLVVNHGDASKDLRTRIVVIDSTPTPKFGEEVFALRLEPNGQWIIEKAIDQYKKGDALFIAASFDKYSGKMFCDCDVRFPYDFEQAYELSASINEAFRLTHELANEHRN